MTTPTPRTEAGKQAVKLRGLFGGETEVRAAAWVARIEADAAALAVAPERLAGVLHRESVGCDHVTVDAKGRTYGNAAQVKTVCQAPHLSDARAILTALATPEGTTPTPTGAPHE